MGGERGGEGWAVREGGRGSERGGEGWAVRGGRSGR